VYNSSSNELVRTKTLVKNCIVQIDATPFRQWFESHYGTALARKSKTDEKAKKGGKKAEGKAEATEAEAAAPVEEKKKSKHVLRKLAARKKTSKLDQALIDQFATGRLYGELLFFNFLIYYYYYFFDPIGWMESLPLGTPFSSWDWMKWNC